MKKKNSVSEFTTERNMVLLHHFRRAIAQQSRISIDRACQEAVDAPAPRFWVSELRAMRVIMKMLKGEEVLKDMYPQRRRMYEEIYRRVVETRQKFPTVKLDDIIFDIINNPAPCSYVTVSLVKKVLSNRKNLITPRHLVP
ncbi:MAG: hypothetical protein J1F12_00925 [Muribaculaceae bacterium]|nr:hypothetical protein [Muribaculaceae bacterium]